MNPSADAFWRRHRPKLIGGLRVDAVPQSPGQARLAGFARVLELFSISFLILFFELACIRWFGSTVIFLTFFTNIVLMACFPGRLGRLPGRRSALVVHDRVHPAGLWRVAAALGVLWAYHRFSQVMIDVGSQQSPQLIYFGTDARLKDPSRFVVPIEVLAGYFFVLIALMFVGPGQELGRRFGAVSNRVVAYTVDILGSLTGIAAFGLMSYFWVPAYCWFAIVLAIGLVFVRSRRWVEPWMRRPDAGRGLPGRLAAG